MDFHGTFTHKGDYWAVYYDEDTKGLMTEYIIGFEVWRSEVNTDGGYHTTIEYYPLELDPELGVTICSDATNYLGISDVPEPDIEFWQLEIENFKKERQSS